MYPDLSFYPALAFIGPIPMIKRVSLIKGKEYICYVNDWNKLSPAAKARVYAEIDYVEDCCWDRGKL